MADEKHMVWMVGFSVSHHCCFQSTFLLFEKPVTQSQVTEHVNHNAKEVEWRNLFEVLDLTPEEEASILQSMRALYE